MRQRSCQSPVGHRRRRSRPLRGALVLAAVVAGLTGDRVLPGAPLAAQAASGQPPRAPAAAPLTVTAATPLDRPRSGRTPIVLALSRPLTADDGTLVLIAGTTDLSALTTINGTAVIVTPGAFALPPGAQQLAVLLRRDGRFTTVASFPLRIAFAGGFTTADATTNIDLTSNGVTASGGTEDGPPAGQEVNGTIALRTLHEKGRWTVESQASVLGAADADRALRYGQLGPRAPRLDLASYRVNVRAPGVSVDLGHVSMGASRHLVSGVNARGLLLQAGPRQARLTVGSVAGTSIVGWDNLLGLGESPHRLNAAALDLDLLRAHPGGVQLRVSGLDGALQPRAGFTQGAVVDAEASRGGSLELTAATPGQRARATAGYTTSSFRNPMRDSALTGGLPVNALERDRRGARFLEANVTLLQGRPLGRGLPPLSLALSGRHERIDPLFRSVGAYLQADRQDEALELSGSLGSLAWQGGRTRGRDNLANVSSILTSRTDGRTATVTVPIAALLRSTRTGLWPRLAVNLLATHQYAVAAPASNDFRPQDLADQMATQRTSTLQWSVDGWSATAREAVARQDNRQATRELADFTNQLRALTIGRTVGRALDLSLEGSTEAQRNLERNEVARTRRLGVIGNWRPSALTALSTNLTAARSRTPPDTRDATNLEVRAELSQRVRLYGRGADARTGQAFVRYARTLQRRPSFGEPTADLTTTMLWTLNTGLALRIR